MHRQIDRFGRRPFLLIGTTGCLTALIFEAALTAEFLGGTNQAGLSAAVFFIWFYILFWCCFMDATQFVYVSEVRWEHIYKWWLLSVVQLDTDLHQDLAQPSALARYGMGSRMALPDFNCHARSCTNSSEQHWVEVSSQNLSPP